MTDTATNNDDPGADVVGLTARRKADRKRIAAAFDRVARKHGAMITATDGPADPGWSSATITLRGAVYQLPARDGRARYLAAYREGSYGRRGWTDTAEPGAAAIACREVFETERDGDAVEAARDAAKRADSIAESMAEDQREYNEAWQAAVQWRDLGDSITSARTEARQLVADMRAAIKSGVTAAPSICTALRKTLRGLIEGAAAMRAEREALAGGFWFKGSDGRAVTIDQFDV